MARFGGNVLEREKFVWRLRRAGDLACATQAEYEQIEDEAVELRNERGELEAADDAE